MPGSGAATASCYKKRIILLPSYDQQRVDSMHGWQHNDSEEGQLINPAS
jgi:hypothetical protein